jgi:flagellar biosynthesis protein FlhB
MADHDQGKRTGQSRGNLFADAMERGRTGRAPELPALAALLAASGILVMDERAVVGRMTDWSVGVLTNFTTAGASLGSFLSHLGSLIHISAPVVLALLLGCAGVILLVGDLGRVFKRAARPGLTPDFLQEQMLEAVRAADVVVMVPANLAVALRYERGRDRAPVVLAKGESLFAMRIKAVAAEHEVPMIENGLVARALVSNGRIGEPIAPALYQDVAEILAVAYGTRRHSSHRLGARCLETAA